MAFKKKNIYEVIGTALVLSALLSTASAVDCLGKSFHCVNSSHFMICVDVGGGVSQSIDDFTIPCPPPTVCQGNNHFECEFPIMTTPSTTLSNIISESTMPWEEVDVTTVLPPQNTTKEYSEKYMNTESLTSLPVNITDATVDYTTEAASLVDSVSITKMRPAVTETFLYDTTTIKDDIAQPITENNVATGGELLTETANNYTIGQEVTNNEGLVSASTIQAIHSKLNATEATLLIDNVSVTETRSTVTEVLQDDTTTIQNIITQTITEHNEAPGGELLSEIANNYTLGQEVTTNEGLVSASTIKAIPSKLNATEATSLVYRVSITKMRPAVTDTLLYDTTTIKDDIAQPITENNVASGGELLTETANNYTIEQEVTNKEGLVSAGTIKAIHSKLNATEATLLIDDVSVTETRPTVTEALPDVTTTIQNVITQTITEHNEASGGELLTEIANNYTLGQEVTTNEGLVSASTIKAISSKLNGTEATSLIDDVSITETRPTVIDALPDDTTTIQNVITQTITENNVASGGELFTETANNYTLRQEVNTNEGLVSASTIKAISSKLNATEATSLIDDVSLTETRPTVTEALPDDTPIIQNVITQSITEHNEASTGELLVETANNHTLISKVTDDPGLVYNSTAKTVSSNSYTTEAAPLIDDIGLTVNSPAGTEALPYDTSTSQNVITQTITERNLASAGESFTEYILEQELTTKEGLTSTSIIKAIPSKLNATETTSLIDDISVTETGPAVTETLPDDTTTILNVITQTITKNNETSAGVLQKVTDDAGFVYTSTIMAVPSKLNSTEAALLIDDISITETSSLVTEALPYDTTTSKDIVTQTISERNMASAGETLTETANNYAIVQEVTSNADILSTSTEKTVSSKLNTTEAIPLIHDISVTEIGPIVTEAYDSTTSKDVITQTITDNIVAAAGELSTESANTLVQQIKTDEGLVSLSTETKKVDIRKTTYVKPTSESIPTEISVVVNKISTTTDKVFATDANLINTDLWASNTDMLDNRPTTESELPTVDSIITADVNNFTTEQPAVADLLQTTLISNSLNYATTTSESTTVENVVFNKRNLTVFGKDAVTHTNANSGIEISLGQEQNITNKKPLSTKNISSASSPTEQIIVNMFNISISTNVSSILPTETVYLITNDTLSTTNEEELDQSQQTSNSMVTEASVGIELPTKAYAIIPDISTIPSVDTVQNAGNQSMFNYVTPKVNTMVVEKIRTERPDNTLFKENTVTVATTDMVTESPVFLKPNLTDNSPVNQILMNNTSLGSSSTEPAVISTLDTGHNINPDNFARGTEIVTTEETKYNVLDQAKLGPDLIVAVTDLPTAIDDNFTTENNVIKNNEVPSTENTLLDTNMSNHSITTEAVILENNIGAEQQNFTTNNAHLTEAPPHMFAKNTNDNILNPNIVEQAPSTINIDIEENLATAVNGNLTAKKNPIVSVQNLGNSPKHLEFVEYNATGHPKPMIIDENLLSITKTSSSDTENKINSNLLDNLGKSTEKSAKQHNVSTEQVTIKEIQGSITTDTALEIGQAITEVKNTQKQIPVKDAASAVSSGQQIFDKTSDLDVETGTLLEHAYDNNNHITSFTKQIDKVDVADNYHLDFSADGITKEPNYFMHTTSAPFIVTTALAAGEESYNRIEGLVSNSELDTIRPIYNALNPISNTIFNTNVKQSDVNKVESTTGDSIALTSGLSQEKNLNSIGNQAKEYIEKVVDSIGIKEKTTESNLKESETSFHATVATDKPNFESLPINTKSDDSGKTTALYNYGTKPDLINHKDLFIAEETKQLNTNLASTTSINDKNEATLNYDQLNYLTDSSLNDNTKNKTDLYIHIAAINEDQSSTLYATNVNENKNNLQGITINMKDNTILKAQEGSTNYLTTKVKNDVLGSENVNNYNSLQSGQNVHDPQYHNPPTETYIGLDVDNYPKLTIMEASFSHVYKSTQKPLQNNDFTTTASIINKDANIITEKSTSINGLELNEVNVVNSNIYLPQLDTTLRRPAKSPVTTDKQKSFFNTGNKDDDSLTTEDSTKFATADVNVASKKIGTQAIDLPEKTIGHTEATATMSSHVVTQFETSTDYKRDANQNKIDEVPSILQTRNSTPKFPQFNDVKNVHQGISNVFNTASETSSQRAFTDVNYNVAQSKSIVQEPAQTTQENTNTKANASKPWDFSSNIKVKTLESFLPRQHITINLTTEISTDSFKPYLVTSTSRTINATNPGNEAQGINNVLVTGKPMIVLVRNKSSDNALTQPQVVKEIRADMNQISTSSSVTANAEQSHVSSITPIQSLTVSRNLSQPRLMDVKAPSLNQDTNNINNMQGTLGPQDKTITNQAAVITRNQLLNKTSITQADQTHKNGITTQNSKKNITSNVYQDSNFSKAIESINVSQKIGTTGKTLISQNHKNATKEVAQTQKNATSSHKVVNTVNSTTQASVKRVPLRPVPSVADNPTKQVLSSPQFKYNCTNGTRGRYSDKNDCRKFYICVGNNQPIVGTCPGNTVFSDIKKLCTRNMSHCIRENQFKCPLAGRFSDLINDVYYICVRHKNSLYRFKFQCQKGFSLNKVITRCIENKVIMPNDSVSIFSSDMSESSTASSTRKSSSTSSIRSGSRGESDSSNSSQSTKSVEKKETEKTDEPEKADDKDEDESEEIFVCRKEGKFPIRNECRRYYLCKKNGKSEYRRKIKKCRSGDVFHKSKKRCVDAESYEC